MTVVLDTNAVVQNSRHKPQPITPEAFIRDVLGKTGRPGSGS